MCLFEGQCLEGGLNCTQHSVSSMQTDLRYKLQETHLALLEKNPSHFLYRERNRVILKYNTTFCFLMRPVF